MRAGWSRLQTILACPVCRGALALHDGLVRCLNCGASYPGDGDYVDLLPPGWMSGRPDWQGRQRGMEDWYRDLAVDRNAAIACFRHDYTPFAPWLAELSGAVLDLGGGMGLTRHFLKTAVEYVVLDPSIAWRSQNWTPLAEAYPCLLSEPCFVRGIGEYLPFVDASFDVVLAMWSLNHVEDPETVVREAARVLRPSGRLLLVLEDMEPRVRDIVGGWADGDRRRWAGRMAVTKARCALRGIAWPLQSDHIRTSERELHRWCAAAFEQTSRRWLAGYLAINLVRTGRPPL